MGSRQCGVGGETAAWSGSSRVVVHLGGLHDAGEGALSYGTRPRRARDQLDQLDRALVEFKNRETPST